MISYSDAVETAQRLAARAASAVDTGSLDGAQRAADHIALQMRGPCWNAFCIAEDCDGTHHVDCTGHSWAQPRGTIYCPAHPGGAYHEPGACDYDSPVVTIYERNDPATQTVDNSGPDERPAETAGADMTDNFITADTHEIKRQIGMMNVMAISGGRVTHRETGITLPVSNGYSVTVDLAAGDTYTVRRVFKRAGKEWIKGERTDVYMDEVGEAAYYASCFRSYDENEWPHKIAGAPTRESMASRVVESPAPLTEAPHPTESAEVLTREAITPLLAKVKALVFTSDYAPQATDEETLGIVLSKFFEWDGARILEAAEAALEDANFHSESAVVAGLRKALDD